MAKKNKYEKFDIKCDHCKQLITVTIRRKLPRKRQEADEIILDYILNNGWSGHIHNLKCHKCHNKKS